MDTPYHRDAFYNGFWKQHRADRRERMADPTRNGREHGQRLQIGFLNLDLIHVLYLVVESRRPITLLQNRVCLPSAPGNEKQARLVKLIQHLSDSKGLPTEMKIVKGVGVISATAYVACVLGHVIQCLPVHKTWQIQPYPGDNCTLRNANYYIIAVLNTM